LFINLPSDNLSLHDLLKITDLVLNNSSSAGLEASFFGISVLGLGDDLYSYDKNLQIEPSSIQEYECLIHNLVIKKWCINRVVSTYRWLNFLNSEVAIDISDGYMISRLSAYRFWRFARRVLQKALSNFGLSSPFPEVQNRSKPLKNIERLTYAIVENSESHIGYFEANLWGDIDQERAGIIDAYLRIMGSIAGSGDFEFESRFKACALSS
jgi:hypothetical protein